MEPTISFRDYLRAREQGGPHTVLQLARLGIDLFPPSNAQLRTLADRLAPPEPFRRRPRRR